MADELGLGRRRRITWQLLVGVPLVFGWGLFAVKGPAWLVKRGETGMKECLDAAAKAHGDPSGCRTGAGFTLGGLFPEERIRVREAEHDLLQRRAMLAFDHVIASKPDAARRDAAAVQLMHDAPDRASATEHAANAGAFAAVAKVDLGTSSIHGRLEPAFAAITLGDVATARAALARGEPAGWDGTVESAALACLLGERARGLALLRTAAAVRERLSGTPDSEVRITAQHCGGAVDTVGFDPYVVPSFHAVDTVCARLFDPKVQVGRRAAIGATLLRETTIFRAGVIGAFALVADGDQQASPVELLEAVASPLVHELDLDAMFGITPWLQRPVSENTPDYVPPAWLELAASRYARAAQLAPAQLDPDKVEMSRDAAWAPREVLHAAAVLAYEFAAGYRLRRGDRAGARAALEQWRSLSPTDYRRAPLEVATGEPAAALATLDGWQAAQQGAADHQKRELADITRVFALAATGEYAKAHAIAKGLHGRAGSWLVLATAIASGAPLEGLLPKVAAKSDGASPETLLAAIEAKQPVGELGYLHLDDRAVLPAVMVVIAHAAKVAGQDPGVVLDKVFASQMPSRTIALARAEAARWRKDPAAAQLWQRRASAIEKLFVDDDAVVVAGIAGLW